MKRICDTCVNRVLVENREAGVIIEACNGMPGPTIPLKKLGDVTKCSQFEAKDLPYLFARSAWLQRDLADGTKTFMTESDWDRYQDKQDQQANSK